MLPPSPLLPLIPVAYFCGSMPFGLWVGQLRGIDVRKAGSGNIGATNVGRLLGRRFFFVVFILDFLKAFLPMLLASSLLPRPRAPESLYLLCLFVGLAAVLGHMYSIFLKFKGGKGVSTSAGVVFGLWPYYTIPAIVGILIFVAVLYTTRYVSLASMIASSSLPLLYLIIAWRQHWDPLGTQLPLLIFGLLIASMIIIKHRANIARLRAGTENRIARPPGNSNDQTRLPQ